MKPSEIATRASLSGFQGNALEISTGGVEAYVHVGFGRSARFATNADRQKAMQT